MNPAIKIIDAVHPAFALLAALQLDVFTPISNGLLNAEEVAEALGVGVTKLRPLLYALVSAGLLSVADERFTNTPDADTYLVKGRSAYMGSNHTFYLTMWQAELKMAESIRSGTAQAKAEFDYAGMPPEKLERLLRGFHAATMAAGRNLAQRYDFSTCETLLDVGGGSGGVSIVLAQEFPHLQPTVLDQPNVTPITQRIVEESGLADRVHVMTGDIVHGSLSGSYDAAVLSALIQVLSVPQAQQALQNVGRVLKPGGSIYISGAVLDDSRLSPPQIAIANLAFISIYDGGQAYTESEYKKWLTEAGFEGFEWTILPDGRSIVTAKKRS